MAEKSDKLAELLEKLVTGLDYQEIRDEFNQIFGTLSASELGRAQNMLLQRGVEVEAIQRASGRHTDLVADQIKYNDQKRPDQEYGHPAFVFQGENKGLAVFLAEEFKPALAAYLAGQEKEGGPGLLAAARQLAGISRHYERKENVFFPYLEKAGILAPPQVMWGVDDIIRALLNLFTEAVETKALPARVELIADRLLEQVERMIIQENQILLPMLLENMTEADWILAAQESVHVGYVFNQGIEGAANSDAATWLSQKTGGKEHVPAHQPGRINLPSGNFTETELNAMLNTLPTDLTYIDSDDIVRYYSEGKHMVFGRTRTIIGRDIYLCHPPLLVPTIRQLLDDFKTGKKDEHITLLRRDGRIDLVRYYAVRDEAGNYKGAVEVTEEISAWLDLVGEK